jgi:hypothetical protein
MPMIEEQAKTYAAATGEGVLASYGIRNYLK